MLVSRDKRSNGSDFYTAKPFKVKVVDTTAAGDAFTAGLAVAKAEGMSPRTPCNLQTPRGQSAAKGLAPALIAGPCCGRKTASNGLKTYRFRLRTRTGTGMPFPKILMTQSINRFIIMTPYG